MKLNTNSYNGIRIIDSMNLSVPKNRKFLNIIPLLIISFLGIWGTVFSYITMFDITINSTLINFCTILFFVILSIIFILPRIFHFSLLPILIIYIVILYKKWTNFIDGFKIIFNQTYLSIYPEKSSYFRMEIVNIEDAELFLAFSIFILAFIICYATLIHPNFFLGFLCTFPFIECGLYFGKNPDMLPVLTIIIYWTCLLSIQYSGYNQYSGKKTSGFLRKKNLFYAKPEIKFRTAGLSSILIIAVCCIVFIMTYILTQCFSYSRPEKINQIRSDMKIAASEFSFEDLGTSLERFSASLGIGNLKMYNHKLGALNSVSFSESTDLIIETNEAINENIYLKGYTGTEYNNNSWNDFSDSIYKAYNNMFDNFYDNKSFPQDMLTNYIISRYKVNLTEIKIKSQYINEKYNYIPYLSIPSGDITYVNDTSVKLENLKEYSFMVSTDQINENNFINMLDDIDYEINSSFDQYNDFVYENYCNVPDTKSMNKLYEQFIENSDILNQDIYQKLQSIKNILSENAEYTLNPGKTPKSEDFVSYFLTENHKGYCVHFATSGVILARMAGIPARYSEGYVLLKDDFNNKNLTDKKNYKIEIKDNRAHAWAEIYIDGLGWIPYEFTPSGAAAFNDNAEEVHTSISQNTELSSTINTTVSASLSETDTSSTNSNFSSSESKLSESDSNSIVNINTHVKQSTNSISLTVKLIISAICTIIFIIILILVKHIVISNKREKKLSDSDNAKTVLYAYDYIIKLLEYININNNNITHIKFAEKIQKENPWIFHENEFVNATQTALKAKLSMEPITDTEANNISELSKRTAVKIYKNINMVKKIHMKFIKNLI